LTTALPHQSFSPMMKWKFAVSWGRSTKLIIGTFGVQTQKCAASS
jgi:hypothetical protein